MTADFGPCIAELDAGRVVVVPTDTVYGVAALPQHVSAIFEVKRRPTEKAIPILAASEEALRPVVRFTSEAQTLADRFWPGPLTLVLPRAESFTHDLGGEASTIAVRVPDNDLLTALLRATGPLAVTSANRSGEPPAATVAEAKKALGAEVRAFLDGGPSKGTPSTIISLAGAVRVLRRGALPAEEIQRALKELS
jgi:tRNA threonylcarbamoyl adenosine modification protein (Sua5/YciO/YrdC/YwlC family)